MEQTLVRIRRLTLILGAAGTAAVLVASGPREAAGFLAGAAFSLISLRSWIRLTGAAGGTSSAPSARTYGLFLALRYVLLAVALYVIVKVLGITPVATIVGLLVSFAAVILGLLYESVISK
jgi:ABC-type multidrug transport system permease subunit